MLASQISFSFSKILAATLHLRRVVWEDSHLVVPKGDISFLSGKSERSITVFIIEKLGYEGVVRGPGGGGLAACDGLSLLRK